MNKFFLTLSLLMGFVVLISNFLVQFPFKHYGLDEILTYGFKDCIYEIVQQIPKNTQICLFSATIPDEILELTTKFMKEPEKVLVKKG